MKILLDARMYGLEHAGIGRYLINLTEELKKNSDGKKYVIFLRKKYFDQLNFPSNWTKVLADFPHYSLAEQFKLPMLIKNYKPDVVHFPHFNIPVTYHGKFVVTIHDMIMHAQGINATNQSIFKYYLKRLAYLYSFRNAIFWSTFVIVPTEAIKEEIVNYFGIKKGKVKVIHEGVENKFLNGASIKIEDQVLACYKLRNKKYFIYYGNVYPHKNIKRAIEAAKLLNRRRKEKILFVIASSRNVFTKKLAKYIKKANATSFVKLIGFVPDRKLSIILNKSVAFVYPSLSEGFGLQGLEAMGAGTLVLASDIPVFREVYKNNAIYFDPMSPASIEKQMRKSLKLPIEKRERFIKLGLGFIKQYSWSKMAKQTLKVYESCTSLRQGE